MDPDAGYLPDPQQVDRGHGNPRSLPGRLRLQQLPGHALRLAAIHLPHVALPCRDPRGGGTGGGRARRGRVSAARVDRHRTWPGLVPADAPRADPVGIGAPEPQDRCPPPDIRCAAIGRDADHRSGSRRAGPGAARSLPRLVVSLDPGPARRAPPGSRATGIRGAQHLRRIGRSSREGNRPAGACR